jgi:hypothetical protein
MIPSLNFPTLAACLAYCNTYFIPNGNKEITGDEGNNILNGLGYFINAYVLNSQLAAISSVTTGVVALPRPITVFTAAPTSIQWVDNIQNEYYIVNATPFNIPISAGFSYVDEFQIAQTVFPARATIHIAKAVNGSWVKINNIPGTGSLPSETGHEGQFLSTNGSSSEWVDPVIFVQSSDFQPDGVTYTNINLAFNKFEIFFDTLSGFIYEQDAQWSYVMGGGFKILITGINANTQQLRLHLFLKGLN